MREAAEMFLRERTPGARIPLLSSDLVPHVVGGLDRLLASLRDQPPAEWAKWQAHTPEDDEPEDGLIVRDQGTGKDPKAYWQWRPRTFNLLRQNGARISPERMAFIGACQQLHRRCTATAIQFVRTLDDAVPGHGFGGRVASFGQHVLRVLTYEPVAGAVARRHVDKCFLTLHLAENRDGLEVWDQPVRGIQDEAIVFPGLKAEGMSGKRILAAEHLVCQPSDAVGRRWSAVFFVHTDYALPRNAEHLTRR